MGFRIGRKNALHVYPEPKIPGPVGPVGPPGPIGPPGPPAPSLARNSAQGPAVSTAIAGSLDVLWSSIESGGAPSINVPITPVLPGRNIRVICTVVVLNGNATPAEAIISLVVNGVALVNPQITQEIASNGTSGFATITFVANIVVGAGTSTIGINVSTPDPNMSLTALSSDIDIQELTPATG